MADGTPPFSPPDGCGKDTDHSDRDSLWVAAKSELAPLHPAYVIFGGDRMKFKKDYNGLLVPKIRITGIECPTVVDPNVHNYWKSAWKEAKDYYPRLPGPNVLLSVNSLHGRTKDQLHIHLTVLKADVRTQLDKLDPKSLGLGHWNDNRHILFAKDGPKDDSYVYRIAHVDNLDTNPFNLLNDYVASQRDSAGHPYNDRFDQSLAIVAGTNGAGFFLIATQYKGIEPNQPVHTPELKLVDKGSGKTFYGTNTVEALIDRDWK